MRATAQIDFRASDIRWIDTVPGHWEETQFRAVFKSKKVKNTGLVEDRLLSLSFGKIVPRDIGSSDGLVPESYETYQIVDPDDVIFRFTDLQNDKRSLRSARVRERGIITSAYLAVKPVGIEARYAEYLMRSYDLVKVFYFLGGGVRQSLKFSDVALLPVLLPPPVEQRAIADYLDRETQKIDELITEQRSLIEMLRERRQAVVDRGAGESVAGYLRLRYLFTPSEIRNHPDEQVLSVYRDYGVIPKDSRAGNYNVTPEDVSRYLLVRPGDLVVNRMKAWQGSLGISRYRGIVSGDYEVLRPNNDRLLSQFSHLYLRSARMVGQYLVNSTGIRPAQWRLYWKQMGNLAIPVPSLEKQEEIVSFVMEQTSHIDELISESEDLIALSQERRAALITAAVTGQIDVRTAS